MSEVRGPGTEIAPDDVQRTLETGDFAIVFQPIVALDTRLVGGYEALTRFPDGRPPNHWFEEAHRYGAGVDLEVAAIAMALISLPEDGPDFVCLNVSPPTLMSTDLVEQLQSRPLGCEVLLELTEHTSIGDPDVVTRRITGLRHIDIRVALDNVGSGSAGLRHLIDLDPDTIKIDRSLIAGIDRNRGNQGLAAALSQLARSLGWSVIAEGIETEEELEFCLDTGIGFGQGYLLGRPAPLPGRNEPEHPWVAWTEEIWQAANST
jgi:EAL domain-containing protein (putative c-di-GMP-specific phosphodiesterase class I)